jgi:hypothetical protein
MDVGADNSEDTKEDEEGLAEIYGMFGVDGKFVSK